jgi:hypothetical protein
VFVLLPLAEYERLRDPWSLPEIAPAGDTDLRHQIVA